MRENPWQILDVSSIWMKEFAAAMARVHPTVAWEPVMSFTGVLQRWERGEALAHPQLERVRFPLQRGYATTPLRQLLPFENALGRRLRAHCSDPRESPLICTTPFYAPLAEKWLGPVVYYVTDLTVAYEGLSPQQVIGLDQRLCAVARSVCPNSRRLAAYLIGQVGCAPEKITLVPNATRASNLAPAPLLTAGPLPAEIAHLKRPLAGVIGNLSANMDWVLLAEAVRLTPGITWVFVGPTDMPVREDAQAEARERVMGQAHFAGAQPYGELQAYARSFDVAVLPYRKREPTYSGSSTRFYEHLAACRPMLATRGFAELLEMPPLVELVDTPEELADALHRLRAENFRDGYESARWEASLRGTWEERVRSLTATLAPDSMERVA